MQHKDILLTAYVNEILIEMRRDNELSTSTFSEEPYHKEKYASISKNVKHFELISPSTFVKKYRKDNDKMLTRSDILAFFIFFFIFLSEKKITEKSFCVLIGLY